MMLRRYHNSSNTEAKPQPQEKPAADIPKEEKKKNAKAKATK